MRIWVHSVYTAAVLRGMGGTVKSVSGPFDARPVQTYKKLLLEFYLPLTNSIYLQ